MCIVAFMVTSFRDVISLWPSRPALASDLGTDRLLVVNAWWNRDSIPAAEFLNVVRAAEKNGYPVTLELLAQIAEKRRANIKQGDAA